MPSINTPLINHSDLNESNTDNSKKPDDTTAHEIQATNTYIAYPRRWLILFVYMLLTLSVTLHATSWSTIIDPTKAYYHVTLLEVQLLPPIYNMVLIPLAFPTVFFYEKYGLRLGLVLSAVCSTGCALLKLASVYSPNAAWLYVAMIFGAIASVLIMSLPPKIASLWFPVHERTRATALAAQARLMSIGLGFLYPGHVVSTYSHHHRDNNSSSIYDDDKLISTSHESEEKTGYFYNNSDSNNSSDDADANEYYKSRFFILWISQVIPAAVVLVLAVLFSKDKPPTPPSGTASHAPGPHKYDNYEEDEEEASRGSHGIRTSLRISIRKAVHTAVAGIDVDEHKHEQHNEEESNAAAPRTSTNKDVVAVQATAGVFTAKTLYCEVKECIRNAAFMRLCFSIGVTMGFVQAFGNIITEVLKPYKISAEDVGGFACTGIFIGAVLCIPIGVLVDKVRRYKWILMCGYTLEALGNCSFLLVLKFAVEGHVETYSHQTLLSIAYVCLTLTSIVGIPMIPVLLEFCAELTYPVSPLVSCTCLMMVTAVAFTAAAPIFSSIIVDPTEEKGVHCFYVVLSAFALALTGVLSVPEDMRRRKEEERQNKNQENISNN